MTSKKGRDMIFDKTSKHKKIKIKVKNRKIIWNKYFILFQMNFM